MKVTAHIFEHFEGSDDSRAIQGGGGAGSRVIETRTNSLWLIRAYVRAMQNRYDEKFSFRVLTAA